MKRQYLNRFLEFFVVGVCMGLVEDLLAIWFATDAEITMHVALVALVVAVPFAAVSELIVDWRHFKTIIKLRTGIKNESMPGKGGAKRQSR